MMNFFDQSLSIKLVALIPFFVAALGVFIAVFGKAVMRFPFQPREAKTFRQWPTVPRMHSPIYVIERPPTHRRQGVGSGSIRGEIVSSSRWLQPKLPVGIAAASTLPAMA